MGCVFRNGRLAGSEASELREENDRLRKECTKLYKERESLRGRLYDLGENADVSWPRNSEIRSPDPVTLGALDKSGGSQSAHAEMFNSMLENLWPRISEHALDVLQTNLQAAVRNLSAPLNKLTFVKEQSYFGRRPPKFIDVRSGHQTVQVDGKESTDFTFRAKIEWDAQGGRSRISLKLAGAGLTISDIIVQGDLVVELVGMMDAPPLFRGIRLFFFNLPELDFDVEGSATIVSPDAVKRKVLDVIETQISNRLVLPNRIGLKLAKEADFFHITAPPLEGVLMLTVLRADNLRGLDTNLFSANTSDPFCQVLWAGQTFRTETQLGNLAPDFGEFTVPLMISSSSHQKVTVEIINENKYTQNSLLGRASIPVVDMIVWGAGRTEILKLANDRGKKSASNGKLTLRAAWRPLMKASSSDRRVDERGVVSAGVYFASHVPTSQERTQHWVIVQCSHLVEKSDLGPRTTRKLSHKDVADAAKADSEVMLKRLEVLQKYKMNKNDMASVLEVDPDTLANVIDKSGPLSGSREFQWNQNFDFLVKNAGKATVIFRLMSKAMPSGAESELGSFHYDVASLANRKDLTCIQTAKLSRGIYLKVRVQVNFLGEESKVPPQPQAYGFDDEVQGTRDGKEKVEKWLQKQAKTEGASPNKKVRNKIWRDSVPERRDSLAENRGSLMDAVNDLAADLHAGAFTATKKTNRVSTSNRSMDATPTTSVSTDKAKDKRDGKKDKTKTKKNKK